MKNYIICDGNKYIIEDDKIYRIFNNRHIKPTKNNLIKVKNTIENIGKDIFSSQKLNEIAKKNKELYKIDILPEVLERMEKFIKEEYIELFYKNLETVRFEFEDPITCNDSSIHYENGYHDSMKNFIHINAETFDCLKVYAKENNLDFSLVWKIALAHELFHLASCNNLYNETGYIYQGLIELNLNKKWQTPTDKIKYGIATSFNEGTTQFFACLIYALELGDSNFNSFINTYSAQARVIAQLIPLIGREEIKGAYFKNLGMGYINDKLIRIDNLKPPYNELSTNMGRLTSETLSDIVKNTSLVRIQNRLLSYETKYFEMINDKEEKDSLVKAIEYYFVGYWKNIDNMNLSDETKALIRENINSLNYLKEKQKTYHK